MSIIIVAGPTCAGKSTLIKARFPNHHVVDLYDFQKHLKWVNPAVVLETYEACRDALVDAIINYDNVVLEHTLLKEKRRPMYIDAIREVSTAPIDMYFLMPSKDELVRRMRTRDLSFTEDEAASMLELAEIPTLSEGYNTVHLITDDGEQIWNQNSVKESTEWQT